MLFHHVPCLLALALLACPLAGCSNRPARVPAPRINPGAIVEAVFEQADADRDGSLRGSEQQAVPSIAAAAGRLDADGDGAVTRDELLIWLEAVRVPGWRSVLWKSSQPSGAGRW